MQLASAIKLAVADVYGYGLSGKGQASPICDALTREGIFVAPTLLPQADVDRLVAACDDVYAEHPEAVSLESNGSDARIFGVDRLSHASIFKELQLRFLAEARLFYGSTDIDQFCMAGDIRFHREGLGSGSGWHRDSPFRHQFKVIVYLSDATIDRGPFEFVPHSHIRKSIVETSRFLGKPVSEDRYTNAEIDGLVASGIIAPPRTIVGAAGSLVYVDTRGLHRGRPLETDRRRAVTFYIYHKSIPAGFRDVLVPIGRQ